MANQIVGNQKARASYIALYTIARRSFTSSTHLATSQFKRSDFANQPFTGSYDPAEPTSGPLGDVPILGAPSLTPKVLKQHLDQFVVGQERAKKIMSVAVFNHYQRILELQRREEEEQQKLQQRLRREKHAVHPVEDEFPGQSHAIPLHPPTSYIGAAPLVDNSPMMLEKSNILLLGPSGVGKTLMAKTLARVLSVPFSMSDCTPFTQAGYIGEDADVCVERLLAAANYDVEAAENGIICLDEIDKIAASKPAHGKDVSGEGVQQALLKIIEGTTLQIQAKPDRGRNADVKSSPTSGSGGTPPPQKGETYSIKTDNILFICTGAFIGLNKTIMSRISKGSIGFGSPIKSSGVSDSNPDMTMSVKPGSAESAIFEKNLPFFTPATPGSETKYNPLDLVEPADLQAYGMIPELVGRIPVTTALSALDEEALVRVLTEPRNSLVKQYEQLFALSGVELRFTSGALREIARSSMGMGTGARGLRTCVERLLSEAMFEAPGSSIKHILITEAVAQRKEPPIYLSRGQQHRFQAMIASEEEEWEARTKSSQDSKQAGTVENFQEYREKSRAAGVM
jgi:ATP-dependent Clp protease ATP-binding subunit ClpX